MADDTPKPKRKKRGVKKKRSSVKRSDRNEFAVSVRGRQAELIQDIKAGKASFDDWDLEELIRGYRRSKNGRFSGRPPAVIPREIHDELARRVKSEVAHELRGLVGEHVAPVLRAILAAQNGINPEDVPGLRLQAAVAQDLLDRFVVSKTDKIEIAGTMKHEAIIANVTVARDVGEDDDDIIDVTPVDEEDDDDEWEVQD